MICCIYKITNNINNKIYIGQTWNTISERLSEHNSDKNCKYLHNAMQKHGKSNFIVKLITVAATQETADYWETYFITKYNSTNRDIGYNLRSGGSRGKHSISTKILMSKSQKGHQRNKHLIGVPRTEETKNKISLRNSGNNNGMFGKTSWNKGKTISEETKLKMSLAAKNRKRKVNS